MAKEIKAKLKLQIPAERQIGASGWSGLGQHGINIASFVSNLMKRPAK